MLILRAKNRLLQIETKRQLLQLTTASVRVSKKEEKEEKGEKGEEMKL